MGSSGDTGSHLTLLKTAASARAPLSSGRGAARGRACRLSSAKLAGKAFGHSYPLAGGPKGYTCMANPDANGKVLAGSCQIGPLTAVSKHVFSWGGRP